MKTNVLLTPVPVRFSNTAKRRIISASRRFKLKPSELIRQAVNASLPKWERAGAITIRAAAITE